MVFSKTHSPHVGTVAEVDLTKVMALRDAHKGAFAKSEGFALDAAAVRRDGDSARA